MALTTEHNFAILISCLRKGKAGVFTRLFLVRGAMLTVDGVNNCWNLCCDDGLYRWLCADGEVHVGTSKTTAS